jgi:hypothetical protein
MFEWYKIKKTQTATHWSESESVTGDVEAVQQEDDRNLSENSSRKSKGSGVRRCADMEAELGSTGVYVEGRRRMWKDK